MKKIVKSVVMALVIGMMGLAACTVTADTACAASPVTVTTAIPIASVVGAGVGASVGAAVGAGAGAIIGGIGVVACGTGFGIPVGVVCLGLAAVCGAIGAGVGSAI